MASVERRACAPRRAAKKERVRGPRSNARVTPVPSITRTNENERHGGKKRKEKGKREARYGGYIARGSPAEGAGQVRTRDCLPRCNVRPSRISASPGASASVAVWQLSVAPVLRCDVTFTSVLPQSSWVLTCGHRLIEVLRLVTRRCNGITYQNAQPGLGAPGTRGAHQWRQHPDVVERIAPLLIRQPAAWPRDA